MLQDCYAFSGYSVNDKKAAKEFYGTVLGLDVDDSEMGLQLKLNDTHPVFLYEKPNHEPATFTVLNFSVKNIDETMDELIAKGVEFEHYDDIGGGAKPDEKGVLRGLAANMGPDIAWFKDPAGNVLSILQEK
jgi:predicted enzyme related to lactoylglutathione lyase